MGDRYRLSEIMTILTRYEFSMPHNLLILAFDGLSDQDFKTLVGIPENVQIRNRGRSAWSQGIFDAKFPSNEAFEATNSAIQSAMAHGKSPIACAMSVRTDTGTGETRLSFIQPQGQIEDTIGWVSPHGLKGDDKTFSAQTDLVCRNATYEQILQDKALPLSWIDDYSGDKSASMRKLIARIMENTQPNDVRPTGCVALDEFTPFSGEASSHLLSESAKRSAPDPEPEMENKSKHEEASPSP